MRHIQVRELNPWDWLIIGSGNGLSPHRQMSQMDSSKQTPVKFESKYANPLSRKYNRSQEFYQINIYPNFSVRYFSRSLY